MMQEKNNLEDMTKKYKEEMMRLYSRKPKSASSDTAAVQTVLPGADSQENSAVKLIPVQTTERPVKTVRNQPAHNSAKSESGIVSADHADGERKRSSKNSAAYHGDLSNPPMPKIPENYPDAGVRTTVTQNASSSKFLPADEILRNESREKSARTYQPVSVVQDIGPVTVDEHNQGNYTAASPNNADMDNADGGSQVTESYPDEKTDFSAVDQGDDFSDENPPDMNGQGYLQVEVTTASGAVPVRDATVIISERVNGIESLIGMVITDENGTTPIVPLSAPPQSLSESPDPFEKPYSEYNISVYKKGFYSIPGLTVPIFDTIKSIQPVSVIPLAEFELNGAEIPNEKR